MIIEGSSTPECWLNILKVMVDSRIKEISPLIAKINVNGDIPDYASGLENDLDAFLDQVGQPRIYTTASTIFPESLSRGSSSVYDRFDRIWKHVKHDTKNRNGHYFRRLTAYKDGLKTVNQLTHIVNTYNGIEGVRNPVHRRSALIATIFDPTQDHTAQPQRGFPCLQQVCFIPAKNQKMSINAIYAMQYLSDRAYGNYLGLERLGHFMGREMGLELNEINCIASVLDIGKMSKAVAKELLDKYYPHA